MTNLFEQMSIVFDQSDNTIISKDKLLAIIKKVKSTRVYSESASLPTEYYALVNKHYREFYPFPIEELEEWEKDGSCEKGDALYQMKLLKEYK